MQPDSNPYQSPSSDGIQVVPSEIRRPAFATFLIGIWLLEGGFKAYIVGSGFLHGFNPLPYLADEYRTWNPILFFLLASFFLIETLGPWIGIYYLTGGRSRTIPFEKALWKTLKIAGGIAVIAAAILVLYCEVVTLHD